MRRRIANGTLAAKPDTFRCEWTTWNERTGDKIEFLEVPIESIRIATD